MKIEVGGTMRQFLDRGGAMLPPESRISPGGFQQTSLSASFAQNEVADELNRRSVPFLQLKWG